MMSSTSWIRWQDRPLLDDLVYEPEFDSFLSRLERISLQRSLYTYTDYTYVDTATAMELKQAVKPTKGMIGLGRQGLLANSDIRMLA